MRNCKTIKKKTNPYLSVPAIQPEGSIKPAEILGANCSLELEIGFGRGRFIIDRAIAKPESKILGFETKRKMVFHVANKAKEQNLQNIVVLHSDARIAVTRMVPDGCFSRVFVNFPDPWWKAKHQKRMVVTDSLTQQVVRLLEPGGEYFVQTDVDFRAEDYLSVLQSNQHLVPVKGDGRIDHNPFNARSSRERTCEELEMPIFRMLFKKVKK